jgi:integrase
MSRNSRFAEGWGIVSVVKVRLRGLNVVRSRNNGPWYVYVRATGECLVKAFEGSREDLQRHLEGVEFAEKLLKVRKAALPRVYGSDTLGGLVAWYKTENPRWTSKLAPATREQYQKVFDYLEPEFDVLLADIDTAGVYAIRNAAAKAKYPRFADILVSCLSRMFRDAIPVGKMKINPAAGVERVHKSDRNANREWSKDEWEAAIKDAPSHILTPLMIARYAGFRGQTIAKLTWANYQPDPIYGKCFRIIAEKNEEQVWVPVLPVLQAHLDSLGMPATKIAVTSDKRPWKSEKQMQQAVSDYLKRPKKEGRIMPGATLHGLRVTYAAEMRREGSDVGQVAAALGDRSDAMGRHYTRHVDAEVKVIAAFGRKKKD